MSAASITKRNQRWLARIGDTFMDQTSKFASINTGLLTDLVRRLTSIPTAEVSDSSSAQIYAGHSEAEIYRLSAVEPLPLGR